MAKQKLVLASQRQYYRTLPRSLKPRGGGVAIQLVCYYSGKSSSRVDCSLLAAVAGHTTSLTFLYGVDGLNRAVCLQKGVAERIELLAQAV